MAHRDGPPEPRQVTIRMPLDVLPSFLAFDIGAHVLNGLASQLQFTGKAELAGKMRAFAVGLEQERQAILDQAQQRVQIAQPGDVPGNG